MARYELPYKKIQGVYFQPWRGGQYAEHRPRLLVVGMSHYRCDVEVPDFYFTNQVIEDRIANGDRGAFFTNIVATCTCNDELPSQEAKIEFWHSIAFYNYVQEFVGDSPRTPHPQRLWSRSHDAFGAALRSLNPELIMVVGDTNWNNMPPFDAGIESPLEHAPKLQYAECGHYRVAEGKTALAFHVRHTSGGYNFRKFAPLYRSAEKRALARGEEFTA